MMVPADAVMMPPMLVVPVLIVGMSMIIVDLSAMIMARMVVRRCHRPAVPLR